MATLSKGTTYTDGMTVTYGNLNALVDSATISGIVNADIDAGAAIAPTKLAQITTASKVSGAALTALANIPAGAGVVPVANLGSGTPGATNFLRGDGAFEALTTAILPAGTVLQTVYVSSGAVATGTTAIPFDDTDPNPASEGTLLTALNTAITPSNANNILLITGVINLAHSGDTEGLVALLWKDSDTTSLHVYQSRQNGSTFPVSVPIHHYMVAGTTNEITFKINFGSSTGSTTTVNGFGGARKYAAKLISSLTIQEIKA